MSRQAVPRSVPLPAGVCPACRGHGADPLSDNVNWLPCNKCGGDGRFPKPERPDAPGPVMPVEVEGEIYCEFHGCTHAANNDPYGYGYESTGEKPECGPGVWRRLYACEYLAEFDYDRDGGG